jgi:teichuronic acid biosynthesis glycosyltransferase TuaG
MKPLVSIITPLYNSENFISNTIESVISQTYDNWELLIVDDNSSDNSFSIVEEYSLRDKRIKVKSSSINLGAAEARNLALRKAKGKYIAFLDSDDIWLQNKLKVQVEFMENNSYPISFTSYELIDKNNNLLNKQINSIKSLNLKQYLKNTRIGFSTSMINKEIVGDFQMMNIRTRQDGQLWISLLKRGFYAYGIENILVRYRVHPESISSNKIRATIQIWRLYYKIEKLGFLPSCYYFVNYLYNAVKKRM